MKNPSTDKYFYDVFVNTNDLIHFANKEGMLEIVNPSWQKTLGYSEDEIIGTSIYDFIDEQDHANYRKRRSDAITEGISDDFQVKVRRKDGKSLLLEGNIRPFYSSNKLVHTRGVFRDVTFKITQIRKREEQLSRLTQFFQKAPDAVVVIDEDQLVVEWNTKSEAVFGFSREEAIKHPLSELIIPLRYREAHRKGMTHFLKTGEGPVLNTTIEVDAINKGNKEFPISLSISNVKIGKQWFFIAFMEDITDKIEKQKEFVRQQIELNDVREGDQRSRDFLNIASHELKTPLTAIKAFAQLALRGVEKDSKEMTTQFLKQINETSDKLNALILSLLDISRIQSGKFEVDKMIVSYNGYLQSIIESSRIIYPNHTILFTSSEKSEVELDPIRLEQAVMNLINNAVKYSPGSDLIEITTRRDNNMVVTDIKDYGIGIPKSNHSKVFEKFFQLEELPKRNNSGLGIGLFITSEIISQHNGLIWVQNNDPRGSTFSFSLPVI
ncbi:PAS domain S-box protein [Daejeonella sp.]|uniref:sensor histidine kinase n=1 Tax=Daejeonella sp. TaxID=2805397 RepID=UPI0030BB3099